MLSSKCAVCSSKKSRFMKEQERNGKGILSSLGLKTSLSKAPLFCFCFKFSECNDLIVVINLCLKCI